MRRLRQARRTPRAASEQLVVCPPRVTFNGSSSLTRSEASTPGAGGGIFNNKTGGAAIVFGVGWSETGSDNEPENIEEV